MSLSASNEASVPAPWPKDIPATFGVPRWLSVSVTAFSAFVFFVFTTHGTFNPGYQQLQAGYGDLYFLAQAQAMVHGHLFVSAAELPAECFTYHNRCYGYFGLTPSVLRLPFLPLLDHGDQSLTPVYMTIAMTLAVASALAIASLILRRVRRTRRMVIVWGALALTLGPAGVLMMVARPAVYEEAIAWSVGFALLGLYSFLRWWSTGRRGWGALLVLSLVLSTNARPTTLPLGVVLGIGIALRPLLRGSAQETAWPARVRLSLPTLAFATVVAGLPVLTALGAWYLKFHTPVPSVLLDQQIGGPNAAPWWLAIRRVNHNHLQGVRFLPTALVAYLRPDDVSVTSAFPYLDIHFGPLAGYKYIGIPPGSMYIEPFSTVTDDMPIAIVLVLSALASVAWGARRHGVALRSTVMELLHSPLTYCVLGTAAGGAVMLSSGWLTNRYVCDMYPLLAVLLPITVLRLAPAIERLSGRAAATVISAVWLLVLWALVFDVAVEYQTWWHLVP